MLRTDAIRPSFILAAMLIGLALAVCVQAHDVLAVSFVVTKTDDTADGACTPSDCSLREAAIAANALAAGTGVHTITLQAGATYTLTRTGQNEDAAETGDLDILQDVQISAAGGGTTVVQAGATAGNGIDRVFDVRMRATLRLTGVTVQNGISSPGGGVSVFAGSITGSDGGTLILTDSVVADSISTGTASSLTLTRSSVAGGISGAAQGTVGTVTLVDSSVVGGISNGSTVGGYSGAQVTMTNSSVTGGVSNRGYSTRGILTLANSTITGDVVNNGGRFGGHILTMTESTIAGNVANGGGVDGSTATLTNSAVYGGLTNYGGTAGGGKMTLTNSTIGGDLFNGGRPDSVTNRGMLTVVSSTIQGSLTTVSADNNNGSMLTVKNSIALQGCDGFDTPITMSGTNLGPCPGFTNQDPLLGPLQDNGGFTPTFLPNAGGPAVTQASASGCTDANNAALLRDQRGVPRPAGGPCHVGAVQIGSGGPIITEILDQTIAEDGSVGPLTFLIADSDTPAASADLTGLSATSSNQSLVPNASISINGSGGSRTVTVTPLPDAHGSATITIASEPFILTVTPVADTPSITLNVSTLEETTTAVGAVVIILNAADGPEVSHVKVTSLTNGTLQTDAGAQIPTLPFVPFGANGTVGLRFSPAPNFSGTGGFSVQASTSANDSGLGGDVVSTTVSVTPVNDPPTFALGAGVVTVLEDSGPYSQAWATAVSPGPANESQQVVAFQVTANSNPALFAAQPTLSPGGTLAFTPAPNANGSSNVTVVLKDDGGTTNGGNDTAARQILTITITPVNDLPIAAPDSYSATAGQTLNVLAPGVLANDTDLDSTELQAQLVSGVSHGLLSLFPDGGFGYQPATGFVGIDSFTYRVSDGTAASGTGTVALSVGAAPAPVRLTVTRSGGGSGAVTSSPAGITCGTDCTEDYSPGTQVTLTATPAADSSFVGWDGACTGTGTCRVTMDATKDVTATFRANAGGVQVRRQTGGPGGAVILVATLTARTGCGSINYIQFGEPGRSFDNATVTLTSPGGGPGGQSLGFTYTPPQGTTSVTLLIQRVVPSGGATVGPILFVDGCGEWRTFVGGGPNVW